MQLPALYTLRNIPPNRFTDAPGLTLSEAFTRMMALSGRAYMFTRTASVMHLLMTDPPMGVSEIQSRNGNDWAARMPVLLGRGHLLCIGRRRLSRSRRTAGG